MDCESLLFAFQPLEDLANFGLNSLFIVTDVAPRAKSPSIHSFTYDAQTGNATLRWDGPGKTFQVERSAAASGPYFPASPILPDLEYLDPAKLTPANAAYYRIRQW